MKKTARILLAIAFALTVLAFTGCRALSTTVPAKALSAGPLPANAYPVTIANYDTDGNPYSYRYDHAPNRVVVSHPGATELLLEFGLEDRILATVAPYGPPLPRLAEKYARLTLLKAQFVPSQEEVLAMQPDLIIGWAHHFVPHELGEVRTWGKRSIATYILPSSMTKSRPTVETAVYPAIADIGKIFGITDQTDRYIQQLQTRINRIKASVQSVPRKKTVIVLQNHGNGRFTLYDESYLITHLVDIAGGKNLNERPATFVGAENILAFDPDSIIFVTFSKDGEELTHQQACAELRSIKELRGMRAVRQANIIDLPFFTVNNGGVRTIDAIEKIAHELYPERFPEQH